MWSLDLWGILPKSLSMAHALLQLISCSSASGCKQHTLSVARTIYLSASRLIYEVYETFERVKTEMKTADGQDGGWPYCLGTGKKCSNPDVCTSLTRQYVCHPQPPLALQSTLPSWLSRKEIERKRETKQSQLRASVTNQLKNKLVADCSVVLTWLHIYT